MASSSPPLKYASDRDFTASFQAITSVILVLSTTGIIARVYARYVTAIRFELDDFFAIFGYLSLLGHLVANYLMASNHYMSNVPPSGNQIMDGQRALDSTAYLYPFSAWGSKLSLLFLIRRIFTMNVAWFRWGWWFTFIILFPFWIATAMTLASLAVTRKITYLQAFNYAGPGLSIPNAITDLFVLLLPIKMTMALQMDRRRRRQVIGVFALGFVATGASVVRAGRNVEAAGQNWDQRYYLFETACISTAELGAISLCACLPVARVAIEKFENVVKSSISGSLSTLVGSKQSIPSMRSSGDDDRQPIAMDSLVVHRTNEYSVTTAPKAHDRRLNSTQAF